MSVVKMKKDVKKSSYYVWFLGAQECNNVRDVDCIVPIISALAERERKMPPHKFTLQVSHRGLKIVHNAVATPSLPGGKISKSDLVKHLIPDHAITCVHRDQDLVAVILLLYNPVTKWPVHVHVYRCDSAETSALLSGQLQTLVDRPDNKRKLDEIESRLSVPEPQPPPLPHRDNGRRERKRESPPSSSSESGVPVATGHMTSLYDSLAAELKKKLATGKKTGAPILLPPRDYDTVHRHRGNLNGIDLRRCMSTNIVGVNAAKQEARRSATKMGSSGDSSGIGSDHAPSPEQYERDNPYADNNSSSDDDWNAGSFEEPLFAKSAAEHPVPRVRRQDSGVDSNASPVTSTEKDYYGNKQERVDGNDFRKQTIAPDIREKYSDRNVALVEPRPRKKNDATRKPTAAPEQRRKPVEVRQRTPSPDRTSVKDTPRDRFKDAKEKFLMLEKERIDEQRSALKKCLERQRKEAKPAMIREAVRGSRNSNWSKAHDSDDEVDRPSRYVDEYDEEEVHRGDRRLSCCKEDCDYDYEDYPKPVATRRSRIIQEELEPRSVPRSYSDDYLEQNSINYRPSSSDVRYGSPQRRTVEVPRAAPRRNHFGNDAAPRSDYKRRSTAAYENAGSSSGYGRHWDVGTSEGGRRDDVDYKRRSEAYAYDDHRGGELSGGYGRRDMDKRTNEDVPAYPMDAAPVSPRYRHSYAEPYHRRHHQPPLLPPQDPLYRQHHVNGRIGIAAIHPY
ncbi:uncharacterized protein LOC126846604 [Adelges cooleyi]|uniref:uncharacterized protein LOC126846604 n=1 Tax=Adelges cooleyi TaxID=133065 RepID=UPI00218062E9|nr:uncharacterized protein LOC126846604 [Adelges cooleyi]